MIPREVPALPKGHVPRKAILDGIKRSLFALGPSSEGEAGGMAQPGTAVGRDEAALLVQGMGGRGKTVVASSVARDPEVGARFDVICFVGVGQYADLRELQRSLHFQLVQSVMETSLRGEEAFAALQTAAAGRNLLLLVDDAWRVEQVRLLKVFLQHCSAPKIGGGHFGLKVGCPK